MVAVALLRHKTGYLARYTTAALLVLLILGTVRVFIPISIPYITVVVHSYRIIPRIESFLRFDILPGTNSIEVQRVLLVIWGAGIVVMGIKTLKKVQLLHLLQKLYRTIDNSRETIIAQKMNIKHTSIFVSNDVSVPYVTGCLELKFTYRRLACLTRNWK